MTNIKKRMPLEEGQRIWIESAPTFYKGKRTISEYEIVEANNNSAYAVDIEDLGKEKPSRKRIEQRTRKVFSKFSMGESYYFWETKEAFERSIQREEEGRLMRKQAIEKVQNMNFEQLKEFLSN